MFTKVYDHNIYISIYISLYNLYMFTKVCDNNIHSWAQRKLSPLSPLNILLSINGPLISLGFNGLND